MLIISDCGLRRCGEHQVQVYLPLFVLHELGRNLLTALESTPCDASFTSCSTQAPTGSRRVPERCSALQGLLVAFWPLPSLLCSKTNVPFSTVTCSSHLLGSFSPLLGGFRPSLLGVDVSLCEAASLTAGSRLRLVHGLQNFFERWTGTLR
jgi:hypothetical protein